MGEFVVFPAIDLRGGRVVRLKQGDPGRVTVYGGDPVGVAEKWMVEGAKWLHVVNLDGAFGEGDALNRRALEGILGVAQETGVAVQFGWEMRSLKDVEAALQLGVRRVILGTVALENPDLVGEAIRRWGVERVGVGIDARDGKVRVRGWMEGSEVDPVSLGVRLAGQGVRTVVFTNIARDGVGSGPDVEGARELAARANLEVIASGGVASARDVEAVRGAGLAGIIIGRALYEGGVRLEDVIHASRVTNHDA